MSRTLAAAAALTGCLLVAGTGTARAAPPEPHWRTAETDHFRIHYYDEELELARRAAVIAERAHALLTRYLNWMPAGRIDITLTDQTDSANGFANSMPFNYIYGFGVPPDDVSSLNDFDDWLSVLIAHELTHVVHLDITLGFSRVINFVLGKTLTPNQFQPNWFIEGIAVLEESRLSTGGRIRSAIYDMFLRVPALEGRLLRLDGVSNAPRAFPGYTAAYLYGSSFLKWIEDSYGAEKLREISHRYGSRLIPFAINRTSRQAVGAGFDALWDEWMASLRRRYALQVEEVDRRGRTLEIRLTFEGDGSSAPSFLPDGRIVYTRYHSFARSAFVALDPRTGERETIIEINGAGHATPTPDGRRIVFQQVNYQALRRRISGSSHADWEDLFVLDRPTGEIRAITDGRRAHEPEVSPDGARVAFAATGVGGVDLAVVPIAGGEPEILAHTSARDVVFTPSWSPDGSRIAYSRWKTGGFRDIHVYDLGTRSDTALMLDRAIDTGPRYTPDGRFIVFSSDRNGIYNLYAWENATGKLWQVTNLVSGALQPAVSPDGKLVAYMGFSSAGFDIFSVPLDPGRFLPAEPFVNPRDDAAPDGLPRDPDAGLPAAAPSAAATTAGAELAAAPGAGALVTEPDQVIRRTYDYRPWRHMYPRAWDLAISSNSLGLGPDLRLGTVVSDPAILHGVALTAILPIDGDPTARVDYNYAGLWPFFNLHATRAAYRQGGLVVSGENRLYREHYIGGGGQVALPVVRKNDAYADVSAGYNWQDYAMVDDVPAGTPDGPVTRLPGRGPDGEAYLSWYYSNVQAFNYSVSGQQGRHLQLGVAIADPALGGRYRTSQVGWNWKEFWTPPWASLQAVGLSVSGGVGIGEKRGIFHIGGFREQDLVRAAVLGYRQCCLFLRGYRASSIEGDQFHIASLEYRGPLLWFERGYETFPFYLRRLTGAIYADAGDAFYGDFDPGKLRYGVGGELRLEFKTGYYLESLLQVGVARGLSREGITDFYIVSAFPF